MKIPGTHKNPPPKFQGVEVTPLVIKDLEERAKLGAEKYGGSLHSDDGRNTLIDLYQELLDAVEYIRSLIEQEKTLRKETLQAAADIVVKQLTGEESLIVARAILNLENEA